MGIKSQDEPPDEVEEASRESFPASDPPSWTLGADPTASEVSNNPVENRFEARVHGNIAFLAYRLSTQGLVLIHTEVPTELAGHGLGGKLARAALEFARKQGLHVELQCPFVIDYVRRHPEYADLVRAKD